MFRKSQRITIRSRILVKGQLISEWIFYVWNFPKKNKRKNFCPIQSIHNLEIGQIRKIKALLYTNYVK